MSRGGRLPALRGSKLRPGAALLAALSLGLALEPRAVAAPVPDEPQESVVAGTARAQRTPGKAAPEAAVSELLVFQDIPVVITASRHEQRASEAPATVAIITAEDIEHHGFRTLAEALETVPGVYITYDRNYTYIGVRGFSRPGDYNSRVQMQINGHPMNDSIWDYSAVGEDQNLDMSTVERVEVVYGPGSTLYGSNALLATINVITRRPESAPGGQLALEGGSFGRAHARLSYTGEAAGWKFLTSGSVLDTKGDDLYFPEYDALGQNGGMAEEADLEKAYRFYARADRGNFVLQASSLYREKGIPTGAFATVFNDDATRTWDARHFVDLRYQRALRPDLDLVLRGSYDEYRYWANYRYDMGGGVLVDNTDRSTGRWLSQEAQIDYRLSPRHHFTFGQGFVRNFHSSIESFDNDPTVVYVDVGRSYSEYSAFAQHEYAPARAVRVTSGVRYDDYSTFGSKVSPRLAVVLAPRDTWRIKAMAGRAFRAPNIYELYYESFSWIAGGDLEPEITTSYELAVESRLGARLDGRLALYRLRIRDLISLTEPVPGTVQFANLDQAETRGTELLVRSRFANGAEGYFSHSYMHAEDGLGEKLSNYPSHSWKAGISVPFANQRWRVSADVRTYEERRTLAGTQSPDVTVVNATLQAPLFSRRARLHASIYNLFDREYGLPASAEHQDLVLIPQDGRAFSLRLLWDF